MLCPALTPCEHALASAQHLVCDFCFHREKYTKSCNLNLLQSNDDGNHVSGRHAVSWPGTCILHLTGGACPAGSILLLRELDRQARLQGGAVYMLNGNHESLNVAGNFRCLCSFNARHVKWVALSELH